MTLVAASLAYPFLLRWAADLILPAPTWVRLGAALMLMAPLGFLMGIMFPKGIAVLEENAPDLVPWAWAINGTSSVISTAAAAILALTFGFSVVLLSGATAYALASVLTRPDLSLRSG